MTGLSQGWANVSVRDVVDDYETIDPQRTPDKNFAYVDIGAIDNSVQKITDPKEFIGKDAPSRARRVIRTNDVLFSTVRTYLKNVAKVPPELNEQLTSTGICVLRANTAIDPAYLFHWASSTEFINKISEAQDGTMYPAVRDEDVLAGPIPLPPFPEQRRIVRKLDTLSARILTARSHLSAIEKLVERMRGAILSEALNGRLVASQLDCGEPTELGRFIVGIEQGWSPKCDNEPELDPTKWAVLTTTAIQPITFDSTENKRLPASLSPRPHLELEVGNVLMTRAGPRVRCAVCCYVAETTPRRIFSDKVYRIRLDQSIEPEFFVMVMNAPEMVRALDVIKSGGSESGLNLTQDRLKSLSINVWDRSTQVKVVAEIKRQFAKIDSLIAEAAKAQKLLSHLDQRILAKAFAGDLVPQDPNDEHANVLLERVREARANAPKKSRQRRTEVYAMKEDPKDRLLADSASWPENGLHFEDVAKRVKMPHNSLRDALFELLGGTKPQLEQVFDKTEERMRLKRVAQ
jgi:type I restriction enzyme S subunit